MQVCYFRIFYLILLHKVLLPKHQIRVFSFLLHQENSLHFHHLLKNVSDKMKLVIVVILTYFRKELYIRLDIRSDNVYIGVFESVLRRKNSLAAAKLQI